MHSTQLDARYVPVVQFMSLFNWCGHKRSGLPAGWGWGDNDDGGGDGDGGGTGFLGDLWDGLSNLGD